MPNALAHSRSPYLLQHANNPVDWVTWSNEAFELAKAQKKLIIVSIGYSACHWCHVMEHESFENQDVADVMNTHFISIKVDREERPDVDHLYMESVQLMTGQGGWPLNVICLPDGRPIFGGTYFPQTKWIDTLSNIVRLWKDDPNACLQYGDQLVQAIQQHATLPPNAGESTFSKSDLENFFDQVLAKADRRLGGMQGAPKFPMPVILRAMLRYGWISGNEDALQWVHHSLQCMASGGIYDHIGGGFARYSTDAYWKVPHFEKMLYDNAQLIRLYAEAYRTEPNELYRKVVYETVEWLQRDLLHPAGASWSALDADTDGVEGKYYVWTPQELEEVLGNDAPIAQEFYGIGGIGEWEHGVSIPVIGSSIRPLAEKFDFSPEGMAEKLVEIRQKLQNHRKSRTQPGLDDKILLGWNALLVTGMAQASLAFSEANLLHLAERNYRFLMQQFKGDNGRWYRTWKSGVAQVSAFLEDMAHLLEASLELYQVTWNENYLEDAQNLWHYIHKNHFSADKNLFHFSPFWAESLVAEPLDLSDNVIPSANGVMAHNAFLLGRLVGKPEMMDLSQRMLANLDGKMNSYGAYASNWALMHTYRHYGFHELAVVGPQATQMKSELEDRFLPNVLVVGTPYPNDRVSIFSDRWIPEKTVFYLCEHGACQLPTTDLDEALQNIQTHND